VSFLLWTVPVLMGFALAPWMMRSFPARRVLVGSFLVLSIFMGFMLSYLGIWQAVVATAVSALWLVALLLVMAFGSNEASRPYSGVLFTLLLIVAIVPIYSAPVEDLPKPDGPYAVGMKEFVVTDVTRLGLRGVAADAPRKILVRAYYPADNVDGLIARPYMSPREFAILSEAQASLGQPGFMDSYKQFISSNTYKDAPISQDEKFPVVLFSHGFTGPMAENLFIVENMASRGHVVFMASHPGNTRAVIYPDGTHKSIDSSVTEAMSAAIEVMMSGEAPAYTSLDDYWDAGGPFKAANSPMFADARTIWHDDMLAIADALFAGEVDPEIAPVWQAVDSTKFAYVGMSFGGTTAAISCHSDPRCGLAISLDGNNFNPSLVNAQIRMPIVSIQAPLGQFPGSEAMVGIGIDGGNDLSFEPITQAGQSGLVDRVIIANTKHLSFSDNASFWRGPIRPLFMVGVLPAQQTNAAINGLIGASLDEHFRGKTGAVEAYVASDANTSTYSLEFVADWARQRGL
jgi:hypothetical protein